MPQRAGYIRINATLRRLASRPAGPLAAVRKTAASGRRDKPMACEAGAHHRLAQCWPGGDPRNPRQVTLTKIVWYPVAPSGSVLCLSEVWV